MTENIRPGRHVRPPGTGRSVNRRLRLTHALLLLCALTVAVGMPAPASAQAAEPPGAYQQQIVDVRVGPDGLRMTQPTGPLHAGRVTFIAVNPTNHPHQFQLAQLHPGVTTNDVVASILNHDDFAVALKMVDFCGGTDWLAAGSSYAMSEVLPAGDFVLIDNGQAPDGLSYVAHHGFADLHVQAVAGKSIDSRRTSVTLNDAQLTLPSVLPRAGLLSVRSVGTQASELDLVRMAPGETVDQALSDVFTQPQSQLEETSIAEGLSPGRSVDVPYLLAPGRYLAFNNWPDLRAGELPMTLEGGYDVVTVT